MRFADTISVINQIKPEVQIRCIFRLRMPQPVVSARGEDFIKATAAIRGKVCRPIRAFASCKLPQKTTIDVQKSTE
jgi:hypothetical protein